MSACYGFDTNYICWDMSFTYYANNGEDNGLDIKKNYVIKIQEKLKNTP